MKISALVMELVLQTSIVTATPALRGMLNGLVLIALFALVLKTLLGLALSAMRMICTQSLNAPTKASAIASPASASASLDTKVSLVNVPYVLITAMTEALAGRRRFLHQKPVAPIRLLGTQ